MNAELTSDTGIPVRSDAELALRTNRLSKRYGKVVALRDCTFDLPAGRVAALVGPNGAGKTTLLNLVAGLINPSAGVVRVGGADPRHRSRGFGVTPGGRVAYLAQDRPLYQSFSVADMLRFGRLMNCIWDQSVAVRWLRSFDVPLERRCGHLSGGQRTQVALALALGARPDLLLLDEPLANLDPLVRTEVVRGLLDTVAELGTTVLLSTHVVAELHGVADHLLLLANGTLSLSGDVDDLISSHAYLTGPRGDPPPLSGTIIRSNLMERQATYLVHGFDAYESGRLVPLHSPWSRKPVSLEELILDYLRLDVSRESLATGSDYHV